MQSHTLGQAAHLPGVGPDTARRSAVTGRATVQARPHLLVPLLTREAVEELGLEVGMQATARVKSTSVHIDRT
ncbi:TOBE domain-containing protein [Streptomyces sp. NPDC056361]|uniref:TOBE domain-containing protein n=1 Tax=Streptomyces sp. NPDC056361 TaxID=3345795 RepID=UPI0035D8FCAA